MNKDYDYIFKIVIIGDSGVGKSNLILRYVKNQFAADSLPPTIGSEFSSRIIMLDNKRINVQIWDTSGSEQYRSVTNTYYKGALGAFLVFDITRRVTFENASIWLQDLRNAVDPNTAILLVGNKCDLDSKREVQFKEAEEFADNNNLLYAETSACDATNVKEAFEAVIEEIYNIIQTDTTDPTFMNAALPLEAKGSVILNQSDVDKSSKSNDCC